MKITAKLVEWLVKECGIKADASQDEMKAAAAKAMVEGKLPGEKYVELTKDPDAEKATALETKLDRMADALEKAVAAMAKPAEKEAGKAAAPAATKEAKTESKMAKLFRMGGSVEDWDDARVKGAIERYSDEGRTKLFHPSTTKEGRPNPLANSPVRDFAESEGGRDLDSLTDRDKAVAGAWGQYMFRSIHMKSRSAAWAATPPHQKEVILWAMDNQKWSGESEQGYIVERKLTDMEQKALIDDATSGGVEAVPIIFDDMLVTTPILNGEFFPLVNQVPLDRGRRIQGAAMSNPSIEWGGVDDTAITLFDTASFVSAFDTTIYRGQGAFWFGLDFLSDTPIDFAQRITEKYGDAMLAEMDKVVCVGNGTTQPEGVMTKSGTGSVSFSGTTSIAGYESLLFGVHVREWNPALMRTMVFGGTWTSYARAKAIPVGASDYRRLSNTVSMPNYKDRQWMDFPYRISTSMTNSQLFFAVLGKYRMYRRRGLTMRSSVEGDTLIRRNEMLLACTFRFGGQLERGAVAAVATDAPA